jgi:cell division protein YceG involved in septum cleavage
MRRIAKIVCLLVLSLAILLFSYAAIYLHTPADVKGPKKTIAIRRGMTFREVAHLLADAGIIRGITRFVLLGQLSGLVGTTIGSGS